MICNIIDNMKLKIKTIFKNLFQTKKPPQTIEQLLNEISPKVDDVMIDYTKNHPYKPLGGEIKLTIHSSNAVLIHWDLYFLDDREKHQKVSSKKIIDKSLLTSDAYEKIKTDSPTFIIHPPKI